MDNNIKKCLFSVFTTSNTVFCGTSCPDLQKNQEDAFKHNVSEKEKEIIEKFKKIFNLENNEIVGLTVKSFIDGISEFCKSTEPKDMIEELDGHVEEKKVIPVIIQKTKKPFYRQKRSLQNRKK